MEFKRGDIFYVSKGINAAQGSEQRPDRPAVIVSNDTGNLFAPVVEVVYLTTQEKNPLPTHVEIMCKVPSTALCEQIATVYKDRLTEYIRTATDDEMAAIDEALMISLGIEATSVDGSAMIEGLISQLQDRDSEIQDLLRKLEKKEQECEMLKNSDKVVIFPKDAEFESETKLVFERNFYKAQYEALLEILIGRQVATDAHS